MKAIEVTGSVDDKGQLSLDKPLTLAKHSRVRVIILVLEDEEGDDEFTESASESFRQGWHDVMTGNTIPVSQLWS
ncbi:MAG: hypothetical protein QNJ63_00845 [Calothrix sp. MO_192.B10]|nr:hypothetical protein [Calothrix sp. MO_192.B10]